MSDNDERLIQDLLAREPVPPAPLLMDAPWDTPPQAFGWSTPVWVAAAVVCVVVTVVVIIVVQPAVEVPIPTSDRKVLVQPTRATDVEAPEPERKSARPTPPEMTPGVAPEPPPVYYEPDPQLAPSPPRDVVDTDTRTGMATLTVHARPWAKCNIDDMRPRTTRFSVELKAPATYRVRCTKSGQEQVQYVTVKPDETAAVHFDLREKKQTKSAVKRGLGKVVVNAKPWAKCTIGGIGPRTTPLRTTLMGPKRYRVVCRCPGGVQKSATVRVQRGKTATKFFHCRR